MDIWLQQVINGLVLGSMYALVALGYTMVYGIINMINFAHGEVLMVAALTSWSVIGWLRSTWPLLPGWLVLLLALLVACVVAAVLNWLIEKLAYRPLRNSPKLAPLITAMGVSILLQTVAMMVWTPNYKTYPTLLSAVPIEVGGAVISPTQVMILVVTALCLAGLTWLVNATPLGMNAGDPLPLDPARLAPSTFVAEVVMKNETTPFLAAARARGCRTQIGIDMLFEQIPAYLEFFGFPAATGQELREVAQIAY